jgi:hypothetical protein
MRRAILALRVVSALLFGLPVRFLRKWLNLKPRIWHGFSPLHTIRDLVAMDRQFGYSARSVVLASAASRKYALTSTTDFDRVLQDLAEDDRHWVVLADLLLHADIWCAFFDCLFVPHSQSNKNEFAFRLLRLAGIKIIVSVHGSDIPQHSDNPGAYDWVSRLALDYPSWDFNLQTSISRERVRIFSRYAALILPGDPTIVPWLPRHDVLFKYFPTRTDCEPVYDPGNAIPVIVHAPNHRNVKGTQFLLDAVAALQTEGVACELRLVENVPPSEAFALYRRADVIADQFIIGSFGSFALEGCCLGKPVLTYLEPGHLENSVYYLPLVNTRPETLLETLRLLLRDPVLRQTIGRSAREAVARFYSYEAIGEVWDRLYRHVWRGESLALESTRHFCKEREAFPPLTLVE